MDIAAPLELQPSDYSRNKLAERIQKYKMNFDHELIVLTSKYSFVFHNVIADKRNGSHKHFSGVKS